MSKDNLKKFEELLDDMEQNDLLNLWQYCFENAHEYDLTQFELYNKFKKRNII